MFDDHAQYMHVGKKYKHLWKDEADIIAQKDLAVDIPT